MNINESIKDWIEYADTDDKLDGVDILTIGQTGDLEPPFLVIHEASSAVYEQNETVLYGVSTFEINIELHTVPASEAEGGTTDDQHKEWRRAAYDILGDRAGIDWITGRNYWRVFDIRLSSPITEAEDGRQVSKWSLTVIACPI